MAGAHHWFPGTGYAAGLMLLVLTLNSPSTQAASWLVVPLFDARAGYENNPRMRDRGGEEAYQLRSSVGVRAAQDTGSRQLEFQGEAGYTAYAGDEDTPDDGDFQVVEARTAWQGETTNWRLDGRALRDNTILSLEDARTTADLDGELDPGSDIDPRTEDETVRRHRVFLNPSVDREMNERTSLGARYRGRYLGFEGSDELTADSLNHELELRTDYAFTERSDLGVALQGALFRPQGDRVAFNTFGVSFDLDYRVSERTTMTTAVGVRHSEPHDADDDVEGGTGFVGSLAARHRGERWRVVAALERRLLPNSRGILTETDQFRMILGRELSPRWEFDATARVFTTRAVDSRLPEGATDEFLGVSPGLTYRLSEDWSVTTDYRYEALRRVDSSATAEGHAVFVGIRYAPRRRF